MIAFLSLSSWCLVIVVWLFLAMPWVCLQFVIVVFPDHTHFLFFYTITASQTDHHSESNIVLASPRLKAGQHQKVTFDSL